MKSSPHHEATEAAEETRSSSARSLRSGGDNNAFRYIKFCIVGGSGVFVDMLAIFLLADLLDWNLTLGKFLSAEVAIFNNFAWNELWTFRSAVQEIHGRQGGKESSDSFLSNSGQDLRRARLFRLGKFNMICLGGIALSVLLLNLQVYLVEMNLYLANFISIVIASLWNFLLNLKFNWNTPPARRAPGNRLKPI